MLAEGRRWALVAFVAVALVVALVCSALAAAMQPEVTGVDSARVVGRAAFAYMSGLRTFAAAVLWNRLEPQFHGYYEGKALSDQTFVLPTLRLVQALDPQFEQAYYVGAWVVARHGDTRTGIDIARDGVGANPRSGWMRMNLVSLLMLDDTSSKKQDSHLAEEVALSRSALDKGILWNSDTDRFESYGIFRVVFRRAGLKEQAEALAVEQSKMRAIGVQTAEELEHDHEDDDHDGASCDDPDHHHEDEGNQEEGDE